MVKQSVQIFIGCFASTVLLLFRHGYTFGSGDQSEMLPYAKYLSDNSLYPFDFYIQSIAASVPNERYIFSWFLSLLEQNLNWAVFGLHFVATMFLVLGLYRFAQKKLDTEGGRWLAVLAPVLLLYDVNLGGNELYYNAFLPSYAAQVFGLWAFVYAIQGKVIPVFGLLMLTTYVHPLIGVQLWLLINLSFFTILYIERNKTSFLSVLIANGLYLTTGGLYILKIKTGYDLNSVSTQDFLDIITFRAPHHYFPHTFPLRNWLILAVPFGLGWYFSEGFLRFIFRWIILGTLVYLVGIYFFKNPTPLSTQWFATTVWLKTFSFILVINVLEALLTKTSFHTKTLEPKSLILNGLIVLGFLSTVFMTPQYRLFKQKPYDFPFFKTDNFEVNISKLAKEYTPKNALFLIPSDLSEFRFWSERSNFIDYKATNHRQAAFSEWYKRIQNVYKISLADRLKGANLTALANQHFQELKESDFLNFAKNQGVTHVLTYRNVVLNFKKVIENEKYTIYQILY